MAIMSCLRNFNMKNIFELELCNFPNYVIIEKEFSTHMLRIGDALH